MRSTKKGRDTEAKNKRVNGEHERFLKQITAEECAKKNRADVSAKLQMHKPPHIITQHKDTIRPDKTSALISCLRVLQWDHEGSGNVQQSLTAATAIKPKFM